MMAQVGLQKPKLINSRSTMGGPYITTHMISSQSRMLSWLYHSTHNQQMTTQTMTCDPLEKIHNVGFRGTWQREHLIMSMHISCLVLLLMYFIQYLKPSVTKICCDIVSMVALRTKMRP